MFFCVEEWFFFWSCALRFRSCYLLSLVFQLRASLRTYSYTIALPPNRTKTRREKLQKAHRVITLTTPSRQKQEFNARTAHYNPGTPIPARVTVRPDRSFHFELRTPPTATLLLAAAGVKPGKNNKVRGAGNTAGPKNNVEGATGKAGSGKNVEVRGNSGTGTVGTVSLKHVYEIAKIKQDEVRLQGMDLQAVVKCVIAQAGSIGVVVVP